MLMKTQSVAQHTRGKLLFLISQSFSSPDTRLSALHEVFSLILKTLSGETITNSHFIRNQLVSMHACMLSHFSHVHGIFQARILG